MLTMVVPILPEHIWSKVSGKAAPSSYQNKPPIVGDGPFQIVEWQKGKFVRLEANKDYWAARPRSTRSSSSSTRTPTRWPGPQAGRHRRRYQRAAAQFAQLGSEPGIEATRPPPGSSPSSA